MKTNLNTFTITCLFLMSGCSSGIFDWNQMHLDETPRYKKRAACTSFQQNMARQLLGTNYNYKIEQNIFTECGSNPNYKFKITG